MTEEQKTDYFKWLFSHCNNPSEEVGFLLDNLSEDKQNDIIHNVLKYI